MSWPWTPPVYSRILPKAAAAGLGAVLCGDRGGGGRLTRAPAEYYFPPHDIERLAAAIRRLLLDPALAAQLGLADKAAGVRGVRCRPYAPRHRERGAWCIRSSRCA